MNIKEIMNLFIKQEQIKNPRINHIVYRVMFRLGYKEWIKKEIAEEKRRHVNEVSI